MTPTALLALLKVGSAPNNWNYISHFMMVGFAILAIELTSPQHRTSVLMQRIVRGCIACLAIILGAVGVADVGWRGEQTGWGSPECIDWYATHEGYSRATQEAYSYAKKFPGVGYFPWEPLSAFMAEGKLYHFAQTVLERDVAGYGPSARNMAAHVPQDMQFIAIHPCHEGYVMRYFPDFTVQDRILKLPGWDIYRRAR